MTVPASVKRAEVKPKSSKAAPARSLSTSLAVVLSVMHTLEAMDHKISSAMYRAAQSTRSLNIAAEIVSLSVDEMVAFPLPALLGFGSLAFGQDPRMAMCFVELFLDFGVLTLLEQFFKLAFRRGRPPWKQHSSASHAMLFEWWSFPSGHAMRAAYTSVMLLTPDRMPFELFPLLTAAGSTTSVYDVPAWAQTLAVMWAVAAAWARVAKGKHFVADVLVGLLAGWGIAIFTSITSFGAHMFALGAIYTVEVVVVLVNARCRALVPAWPALLVIVSLSWVGFWLCARRSGLV